MKLVAETFRIESNRSQIQFSERYSKVKKIKVDRFSYKTASASNYNMLVILSGWTPHRYNVSNGTQFYTFMASLPRSTLTEVDYSASEDHWDAIKEPSDLSTATIELFINGSSTNTDISNSNPVYIEFKLWIEE